MVNHWTKDLFPGYGHLIIHPGKYRWLNKITCFKTLWFAKPASNQLSAFIYALGNQSLDLIKLHTTG